MVNKSVALDYLNFSKKLTPKRVLNSLLILSSYIYSKLSKSTKSWGIPIAIAFEPTTSCNLRCPECPSGLRSFTRPTGMLQEDLFKSTIDQIADKLLYLTFYFQGEPYLHPKFTELVQYATERGIYTATSTNAHYLKEDLAEKTVKSGLDRLIISIDGTTQDTYESYRIGGKLEKVIEGTKEIVKAKKKLKSNTPHLIFQFLVVKPNEHQIQDVKDLAKELGVDEVRFKTAQIYDFENGSELIPSIERYSRYEKTKIGNYKIKGKKLDHCWKMWHSCVITWDGKVVPCCFDKDATHQLGDLNTEKFNAIWNGQKYSRFRSSLIQSRDSIDICKNCTEGTQIWG